MLNPHHILTFSTGIKKLTQTICIFVILSINSRFSTFVTTTSEFPAKNMKMPDFYSPSAMSEPPHYRNPRQYVAEKYFSFLPVLPSKTDIRNPLSLLAHERSRFATCVQKVKRIFESLFTLLSSLRLRMLPLLPEHPLPLLPQFPHLFLPQNLLLRLHILPAPVSHILRHRKNRNSHHQQ